MLTVCKAYPALGSKVDAGFKLVNNRFDKFDQSLYKVESKVDSWVKLGVKVGGGLIVTVFGVVCLRCNYETCMVFIPLIRL